MRHGLVDRGRLHAHARRRGHGAVRIAHRPRQARADPVVAVAGDLAADPPDRIAERERGRAHVEHPQLQHLGASASTASTPIAPPIAPPYQTRPEPEKTLAEQVVPDLVVVLEQVVAARADDAAEQRGEDDLIRPVHRLAELAQAARDDRAAGEEAQREHHPEGLDRDAEDVGFRASWRRAARRGSVRERLPRAL